MSMTSERLAEIKARASEATPGPWTTDGGQVVRTRRRINPDCDEGEGSDVCEVLHYGLDRGPFPRGTADFIAHAREDIPDMLAEIERVAAVMVAEIEALTVRFTAAAEGCETYRKEAVRLQDALGAAHTEAAGERARAEGYREELEWLAAHLATLPVACAPVPPGERRSPVMGGECARCLAPAPYHEAVCARRVVSFTVARLVSGYVQRLNSGTWEWCHDGGFDQGVVTLSADVSAFLSRIADEGAGSARPAPLTEAEARTWADLWFERHGDDECGDANAHLATAILSAFRREVGHDDGTTAPYVADELRPEPAERLAVAVLVTDPKGRVLLVRSRKAGRGWEMPGGGVEEWETPEDAARREVLEEAGVEVTGLERIADLPGIPRPGVTNPRRCLVYRATGEGEPRAGGDAEEARWVDAALVLDAHANGRLSPLASRAVLLAWAREQAAS